MSEPLLPLQQHPHFATCLRANGADVSETSSGIAMRRRIAGMPFSLVSRGGAHMVGHRSTRHEVRLFTAETPCDRQLCAAGYIPVFSPATIAEWDISGSAKDLRSGLDQKWRNQLRRAEEARLKVSITNLPTDPDHWLLQTDTHQSRIRGYKSLPHWLILAWATLHANDAVLIEARQNGLPLAGMIFLRHGPVATYQIAHASDPARRLNAHRLMLWRAAQHFALAGVRRLDLGKLETDLNPGLARFKLGTGAQARQLGGTWIAVPGIAGLLRQFRFHAPSGQNA